MAADARRRHVIRERPLLARANACVVTEYVISPAGLLERLLWQAAGILGTTARGLVAHISWR
jgi:hypothetical protein